MRFGSLFSGVGGFDMGLEAAGMTPAWQVDIEPQAANVLRYRWPKVDLHADVRNVGRSNLAPVDLVCGGFPCQDLSVAGKRAGLAGERSGLFHEFMRVVAELAPTWVLIENVPGLLSSNGGRDMGTVIGALVERGYGWAYRCLDTQYFGPPQRRLRVFIVGHSRAERAAQVLLEPEGLPWNPPPRREARENVAGTLGGRAAGEGGSRVDLDTHGAYPLASDPAYAVTCHAAKGGDVNGALHVGQVPAVLPFDTTQITSKANRSHPRPGNPSHPLAAGAHPPAIAGVAIPRRLTPVECERLQGWPDDWTKYGATPDGAVKELSDSARYRMCGNGVSKPVAEWIARRIMALEAA